MQLNCMNEVLHVEGHFVGVTKTCEGYTWRPIKKQRRGVQVTCGTLKKSNLKFVKISSTPWQVLWIRIGGVNLVY